MNIPVNFNARWYQQELMQALEWGVKMAVICWARRAGKDFTCFAYAIKKMVEQPMNVVLVFPTKQQGKEAFWDNIENDGFRTLDHIPKALIARQDNTEMVITLLNGSTFRILGAKDPDALRGANGKLYIFSEFVDIDSAALDVVRPIVAVNGGQIIINSTPKIDGISGGTFKILFDRAEKNDKQFASRITAEQYLDDETLEEIRQETIARNGNDFFYRQEFLCDWGQASQTSYYGHVLQRLERDGGIAAFPYNTAHPVYTAWDLGMSDSTAIIFFQYFDKHVRIIDSYETHDIGSGQIVSFVKAKPYVYGWHFLPHDGSVRDSDAISRIEKIRTDHGLINSSLLRREPVEDGIERVVAGLEKAEINVATNVDMLRKLRLYKRKYNPLTGDYMGPDHSTESHVADALRYVYVAVEQEFNKDTCQMYLSQVSQGTTYESDMVKTSFYEPQTSY